MHRGTTRSTYVSFFEGYRENWDSWASIRKANPLIMLPEAADTRRKIKIERQEAREDQRLKARFMSYRLNIPTREESETLLTTDDWKECLKRKPPDPEGKPVVGADIGGGRAWSAAVAVWPNGLTDALAVCAGVPSIEEQERRDRVPKGTYQRLVNEGLLLVAEGLQVPEISQLWDAILDQWGRPSRLISDYFMIKKFEDVVGKRTKVEGRRPLWSNSH